VGVRASLLDPRGSPGLGSPCRDMTGFSIAA
jgi:hypothetical protein